MPPVMSPGMRLKSRLNTWFIEPSRTTRGRGVASETLVSESSTMKDLGRLLYP